MSTIVTRAGKGSALTHNEVDANFVNLNTDKLQSGNTAAALTITSATINGGTITGTALNGTLGATTPSTIAATTISASGVSTFSAGTAGAPAITTTGDTNTGIFFPAADTIAFAEGGTEAMRLDASGNLGLGVTPSAWGSSYKAIQSSNGASFGDMNGYTSIASNYFNNGSGDKYIANGYASRYLQSGIDGIHRWYTAPSGTAGNAITFTQAMTLDASGNLLVGITSTSSFLDGKISSYGTSTSPALTLKNDAGGGQFTASFWNAGTSGTRTFIKCVTGSGATDIATFNTDGTNFQINANSNLIFGTNTSTERMRINASGNVGINTTPAAWSSSYRALQINAVGAVASDAGTVSLSNNVYWNGSANIYTTTGTAALYYMNSGNHVWGSAVSGTGGATASISSAMQLDASGNLLVNATSQFNSGKVCVQDNLSVSNLVALKSTVSWVTGTYYLIGVNSSGSFIGGINQASQTTLNYATSSDERLKDNIVDAPSALESIENIRIRSFDWKEDGIHQKFGVVAQEVLSIVPEAVSVGRNEEDMMGVDYSKFVPRLIKAIQEQQAMIEELKAKVAALEAA
jgi:hypothetical protein